MLDVGQGPGPVCDAEQRPGVVRVLAPLVHLQLHAKKPGPRSVELGLRFVVVVVDGLVPEERVVALRTVGPLVVVVVLLVDGGVLLEEAPAALTGGVVVVVAVLTEGVVVGAGVVARPDPLAAVAAQHRVFLQTFRAQLLTVKLDLLLHGQLPATPAAFKGFLHSDILPFDQSKGPGELPRGLLLL